MRKHRSVSSEIHIMFNSSTIVKHVLEDDITIPNHKFELVDIGDLKEKAKEYRTGDIADILTGEIYFVRSFLVI